MYKIKKQTRQKSRDMNRTVALTGVATNLSLSK